MSSMKRLIVEEVASILSQGLPWLRKVNYETIRVGIAGFLPHEIPCIQIIDQVNVRDAEKNRDENTWILLLQLILKSKRNDEVNQGILFDRMDDIIRLIGNNTVLNITPTTPGDSFIQLRSIAEATDIHSENPFFLGEITLESKFYTATRGPCGPLGRQV